MFNDKTRFGLALVLILGVIISIWAYFYLVLPRDVFVWDESHHAYYGLLIYDDLKSQDWGKFWLDTSSQTLWSFVHSWFLGVWFLMVGPSYASARAFSLFPFIGSLILTYLIAIRINRENGWGIGLIAALFFISAPAMLENATSCMIESLSVFSVLLFVYGFLLAVEKKSRGGFFISGILLGLVMITKYQYGLVFGSALLVLALWELAENRKNFIEWLRRYLFFSLGVGIIDGLWFLTPPADQKIGMIFWSWKEAAWAVGTHDTFLEKLIFFPQVILKYYSFSDLVGWFMIAAALYVIFNFSRKRVNLRILSMFIVIPYIWSSLITHQEIRYISVFMPLLYLLAGLVLLILFEKLKPYALKMKVPAIAAGLALSAFLIFEFIQFPKNSFAYIYPPYPVIKPPFTEHSRNNLEDVLNFFYDAIPAGQTVAWGFESHFLTPYTISFHFYNKLIPFSYFMIQDKQFFTSRYFITIELLKETPYYWDNSVNPRRVEILFKWNAFLKEAEKRKQLKLFGRKEFKDLNLVAKIYKNALYKD